VGKVEELLAALDASIPVRKRGGGEAVPDAGGDVFSITGAARWRRGGSSGEVKVGEEVEMVGFGTDKRWW